MINIGDESQSLSSYFNQYRTKFNQKRLRIFLHLTPIPTHPHLRCWNSKSNYYASTNSNLNHRHSLYNFPEYNHESPV